MAGYLDQYGEGEEERQSLIKRSIAIGLAVLVLGGLGYYLFKNHGAESQGKRFVQMIRKQDYHGAYAMWGCTESKPCPGYAYDKFIEDWGPKSADASSLRVVDSESCHDGVILSVRVNPSREEKLWIDKNSPAIGFSPFPVCPGKNPWAIMLHRTVGQLRKPFLN